MFFNEDTERALLHRDTNRAIKHDNQPLIRSNPKQFERKIGGSGVKPLTKSKKDLFWAPLDEKVKHRTSRLTDMFGEVPPLEEMVKQSKKQSPATLKKQSNAMNKKYQCADDPQHEIILREKIAKQKKPLKIKIKKISNKPKSKWLQLVHDYWNHYKGKKPYYTYSDAMKDAKRVYSPPPKPSKPSKPSKPKKKGNPLALLAQDEADFHNH